MATRFTPKRASELKRGDVLALSGTRIMRNTACGIHPGGAWLELSEEYARFTECFPGNHQFVTQERV